MIYNYEAHEFSLVFLLNSNFYQVLKFYLDKL